MSTQPDWADKAAKELVGFAKWPEAADVIRRHAESLISERDELRTRLAMETANHDALAEARKERNDAAAALFQSCKELREVAAAFFRAVADTGSDAAIEKFDLEIAVLGIKHGFGVRAKNAIEQYLGK